MMKLIIILLFPVVAFGQTRFYLLPDITSDITPSISSSWTDNSSSVVRLMNPIRISGSSYLPAIAANASSGTASTLFTRHVSPPLQKQTISGNVKGQVRAQQGTSAVPIRTTMVVTVVNPAGTIVATLLTATNGDVDLISSPVTNRSTPLSAALSSYTCNTGDRIVVEIGVSRTSGTSARTCTISYVSSQGSDLPENNTSTSGANTWVEFSQSIQLNRGIVLP